MCANQKHKSSASARWLIALVALLVPICVWLLFVPTMVGKAQSDQCLFQLAVPNPGEIDGLHDIARNGWPGVDSMSGGVRTVFADPYQQRVTYAKSDPGSGGANLIIIVGTGACDGWKFAVGHGNDNPAWVLNVPAADLPNTILMYPGMTGYISPGAAAHNHIILLYRSNLDVCGTEGMYDPNSGMWGYDYRKVVECYGDYGFSATTSSTPAGDQVLSVKTYQFSRHGGANYVYNMLNALWLPTNDWQVAPIPTDENQNYSFQGGFTFEQGVNYYFNGTSGNFSTDAGYKCVGDCIGPHEGFGVCDTVSIEADMLSSLGSCFIIDPDAGWGHNGVNLIDVTRSIAVQTPGRQVVGSPTTHSGADVLFRNDDCGTPITMHWSVKGTEVTFWLSAGRQITTTIPQPVQAVIDYSAGLPQATSGEILAVIPYTAPVIVTTPIPAPTAQPQVQAQQPTQPPVEKSSMAPVYLVVVLVVLAFIFAGDDTDKKKRKV